MTSIRKTVVSTQTDCLKVLPPLHGCHCAFSTFVRCLLLSNIQNRRPSHSIDNGSVANLSGYFWKQKVYKCCLPSWNISMREDFDTNVLFNHCCHTFSASFCNIFWTWTRCKQTPYLIDKAILGKMGVAYVTQVANAENTMTCKNTGMDL